MGQPILPQLTDLFEAQLSSLISAGLDQRWVERTILEGWVKLLQCTPMPPEHIGQSITQIFQ